ncbi:MAG: sigma-70 family RNA polymerase sigma factor [Acidobacteria bacterium]|nr:sigma-70 family RNA polymerase sigma factor [Acidobacteriota bacterium]
MDQINERPAIAAARAGFEKLVSEIRPELHRYCARMTGSVIDGEDVVQDTLAKAFYLLPQTQEITNLRSWLFRIAHNKAIDYTRSYARRFGESLEAQHDLAAEATPVDARETAKIGLSLFMRLTPAQRGAVILKDVLGHSLSEIAEILETSIPAIKGALSRGRTMLRRLGESMGDEVPPLDRAEARLLASYVTHFAARDFDSLRALLAEDVRLDVVGVARNRGALQVGGYFHRYSGIIDWQVQLGSVEGRPAILVSDPRQPSAPPCYFILIDWANGAVARIRDYRYARYVMTDAEFSLA